MGRDVQVIGKRARLMSAIFFGGLFPEFLNANGNERLEASLACILEGVQVEHFVTKMVGLLPDGL